MLRAQAELRNTKMINGNFFYLCTSILGWNTFKRFTIWEIFQNLIVVHFKKETQLPIFTTYNVFQCQRGIFFDTYIIMLKKIPSEYN